MKALSSSLKLLLVITLLLTAVSSSMASLKSDTLKFHHKNGLKQSSSSPSSKKLEIVHDTGDKPKVKKFIKERD